MAFFSGGAVIKPSVTVRLSPQLGYWRLLSKKITSKSIAEELNYIARKGRTQTRRLLAQQTKMPYGEVSGYVNYVPAHAGNLRAVIRTKGRVSPLGKYMTSFTSRPKSWRAKNWRQTMRIRVWERGRFPYSGTKRPFVFRAKNGMNLIGIRTSGKKYPIRTLSAPHLPNEVLRAGKPTGVFVTQKLPDDFNRRVIARIQRIMAAGK